MNILATSLVSIKSELEKLLNKVELSKNTKYFFSEHEANLLFKDCHYLIKQELNNLFGEINDGVGY
jgi:hypothetical protein